MKKLCLSLTAFLVFSLHTMAQNVGIGTNNPASKLDVTGNLSIGSSFSGTPAPGNGAIIEGQVGIGTDTVLPGAALQINSIDKGFLPPRIVLSSTLVSSPVANPTDGLLIFNTATSGAGPTAVAPGFYYWDTNHWERVNTGAGSSGATGAQGATGANGNDGATGAAGATGQDGQGELYATTSTTSLGTGNTTVTITVGTGLSYTTGQTIIAANSATRYKIGTVSSYNSATGSMVVSFTSNTGSGTFTSWAVNLNGATQGAAGATGATGAVGATGATGATGAQGASGDKYATTSSTTIGNGLGNTNITVGTGLSYTIGQTVVVANSSSRYKIGIVGAYNASTGAMTVNFTSNTGSGNASSWNVNLDGATQGNTGPTGANGTVGATGATGNAGATGATGTGYAATSATNTAIATGSKTFTTQAGLAYLPGLRVRVANSGTNYMEGTVTSYTGTSLVVNVDRVAGSGTLASWNIGLAGDVGVTGAAGAAGPTGATGATGVTASLLVSASRTSSYTPTASFATLVYNTASVNVGGAYSTSTGEFTAPATGLYQIIVSNNYTVLNGLNNGLNARVIVGGTTDYETSIAMTPYNTTTISSSIVINDIVSMTSGQKASISIGNLVNTMNPSVGTGQHVLKIVRLN